jgi:hypothetical protein
MVALNMLSLLLFAASASAVSSWGPKCIDFVVPVHVDTQIYPPIFPPLKNGYEAVEFLLEASGRNGRGTSYFVTKTLKLIMMFSGSRYN